MRVTAREEFLNALRHAQGPARSRDRFHGVRPALLHEAFHGFFLAESFAALVTGFERRGEAQGFRAETLAQPDGSVNALPYPVQLSDGLCFVPGSMLEGNAHQEALQPVEPWDREAAAVEDLEDRVHGGFVVDLVEDERETILHDTRELDEVTPPVHELRAILDRGQECPVRDGLGDGRVRGLPLAQVLREVAVRVVVHLQ
jgi:hypothetical protein